MESKSFNIQALIAKYIHLSLQTTSPLYIDKQGNNSDCYFVLSHTNLTFCAI